MAAPSPAWSPDAYPASVQPRELAQVGHAGGSVFVLGARLDAGDDVLATYSRAGRFARKYVLRHELAASEPVTLADGAADQSLIPGVAPVALTARQVEAERKRRDMRRGHADLPCGGLWDETAHRQGSLF
jgi:hypothetical protein